MNQILAFTLAYFIGNISPALILMRLLKGGDIRQHGSGNPGAANTNLLLGPKVGAAVLILDILKGAMGVLVGLWIGGSIGGLLGALGVIIGHNWPILLGFRGGKGISATAGALIVLFPVVFTILIAVLGLTILITRYASIGFMAALIALPIVLFLFNHTNPEIITGTAITAMGLLRYKDNIRLLLQGKETKMGQGAVFHDEDK